MKAIQIENSWQKKLQDSFHQPTFQKLTQFVRQAYLNGPVYPAPEKIFNAFNQTPWDKVRVVILGQDPYHGRGQAHGLSFSVPAGVPFPPSLRNIFKERLSDLNQPIPQSGDLSHWAKQGVLLLNRVLTVAAGKPGSHQGRGWEDFTQQVISKLSSEKKGLVFVLWGKQAQQVAPVLDPAKHLVLQSAHPSPFSVHRGFWGSQPFSKTNNYLTAQGHPPIIW